VGGGGNFFTHGCKRKLNINFFFLQANYVVIVWGTAETLYTTTLINHPVVVSALGVPGVSYFAATGEENIYNFSVCFES